MSRQVSGISTTSMSRRFGGRVMPTPQSARESVLHMAVDGFKTLVVCNLFFTPICTYFMYAAVLFLNCIMQSEVV